MITEQIALRTHTQSMGARRSASPVVSLGTSGIEANGGGVLTYLLDLVVLSTLFFGAAKIAALSGFPVAGHGILLLPVALLSWAYFGTWRWTHRELLLGRVREGAMRIARGLFKATGMAVFVLVLFDPAYHPSSFHLLLWISASALALFVARLALLRAARRVRSLTRRQHGVLVIGNNQRARSVLSTLRANPLLNCKVVAILDDLKHPNPARTISRDDAAPIRALSELEDHLSSGDVDEVLITLPMRSFYSEIKSILDACGEAGIQAQVSSDIFDVAAPRREVRELNGLPTMTYGSGPAPSMLLKLKRWVDIGGAAVALTLFGLPMLIIAAAVKLTSKGPVFFSQPRCGLNGRIFMCLKFRTMVMDAEDRKKDLQALNEVSGPVFKMARDPRITRLGRILRKYSLDELPQLINVLVGDMSLVGPRPPTPDEVAQYDRWQRRRLSMRPGLTCIWQVSGRNAIGFDEWIQLDLKYIDNWSLPLDIFLLAKTVPTVIRGTGV